MLRGWLWYVNDHDALRHAFDASAGSTHTGVCKRTGRYTYTAHDIDLKRARREEPIHGKPRCTHTDLRIYSWAAVLLVPFPLITYLDRVAIRGVELLGVELDVSLVQHRLKA